MIPEKMNGGWSAARIGFDENDSCDKNCKQGDCCKHGHRIDTFHVVDEYVPYHAGQTCDKQCPHFNMFCPEIHGNGLEQYDDCDCEEQRIDDAGEVDRSSRGHDKLVDQESRILDGEECNTREHDSDDGLEHKGNERKKVCDELGYR
jgi:hypothetical protein